MANVLIIDDDPDVRQVLAGAVKSAGHEARSAGTLQIAMDTAGSFNCEAVFLDLSLPDGHGLDALTWFQELMSFPEVIIITGKGDPAGAELALNKGAFDFLEKPASIAEVTLTLVRALEYREARLRRSREGLIKRSGIVGSCSALVRCLQDLSQAAATGNSLLIFGETGTGKELFAKAVHDNSPRAGHDFVVVDCSALSRGVMESTLFGHVRGAFTGASDNFSGLVALSNKGTLFLDEIGELDLDMQKKFLRVLEEKKFRPVGASREVYSDFRLVCATNRDLEAMAQRGEFRQDLLYRIRMQKCTLPPLRERREDIPELCTHFLEETAGQLKASPKEMYPEVLEIFSAYEWPGNVRELKNALEQAAAAAQDEPMLHRRHLPLHLRVSLLKDSLSGQQEDKGVLSSDFSPLGQSDIPEWKTFKTQVVEAAEERYFHDLYAHTGGRIKEMARLANLTQSRVYSLINKYKLR
ncbi:putative two component, sigma54 specific, transcriptional regulator, Fis family [Desulfonatronospira thiodismutans ASO3-1]|uniref:Two component, sigma54 specific, transcriptional regulator, Fis family n=1 Tax=Desulfonatronospira thiodismutans ASO3-1 TaxID=555779 RepID=D6SST0_9BACT|nr:sigma-54 dependent transcriptional regulator [Desulfonatronospira thiodismutans]EFI33746.1 putative two component, sigma54 specific, transcriptional regulator, Fis family [Desulfonatronospira thiodismutans ASO3-1]RQD78711.1 MAG: sigma-54-dependent Fis family transcriptional regulator [Desulfonatronospira sp. MSAO_Bac3]